MPQALADSPIVFVSYTHPDRDRVLPYYDFLSSNGVNLWMDVRKLKPGQNWDFEIKKALDKASVIIVFISDNSVDRRGYVQREIKLALAKAQEKLVDDIYIIPLILDDATPIPEQLKGIHAVRASDVDCFKTVLDAIGHQLSQLGETIAKVQGQSNVTWSTTAYRDSWDGLPGYETEFQLLRFNSDEYSQIGEVTDVLRGHLISCAMDARTAKFNGQYSDLFNFGQERHRRTNTWEAFCGQPTIKGKVMSLRYSVHWYGAGAAHPNQHFIAFVFLLDPLLRISSLNQIFNQQDEALQKIQKVITAQLLKPRPSEGDEETYELDPDWVQSGTEDWGSLSSFTFGENGIELSFAPYQVAAYAFGPQFAEVPYSDIVELIQPHWKSALAIW